MDNEIKTFEKFLFDWSRKTQDTVKTTAPIKTGLLRRSILIGVNKLEDKGWRYKLEMVFYGKFVDEGTKFIKSRNFTKAFKDLQTFIPQLEKKYAAYLEKSITDEINKNQKNKE